MVPEVLHWLRRRTLENVGKQGAPLFMHPCPDAVRGPRAASRVPPRSSTGVLVFSKLRAGTGLSGNKSPL